MPGPLPSPLKTPINFGNGLGVCEDCKMANKLRIGNIVITAGWQWYRAFVLWSQLGKRRLFLLGTRELQINPLGSSVRVKCRIRASDLKRCSDITLTWKFVAGLNSRTQPPWIFPSRLAFPGVSGDGYLHPRARRSYNLRITW